MNKIIDQYERIQEYLRGNMSKEDRMDFERNLTTDKDLLQQYEDLSILARAIQKANQEVDLRMAFEESEKQFAKSSMAILDEAAIDEKLNRVEQELKIIGGFIEDPKPSLFQVFKDIVKIFISSIRQWFLPTTYLSSRSSCENAQTFSLSYANRLVISFIGIASLLLAIILPHNANLASSGFNYAPANLELQTFRGSSSDMLENAVNSYNKNDFNLALSYIDKAQNVIEVNMSHLGDTDLDIIIKQSMMNELYQVEWYRALILMKCKKVRKAKRSLRAISESNSPFANEALEILNNVY